MIKPRASTTGCTSFTYCVITRFFPANQMSQTRNTADKFWWPPAPVVAPDHCLGWKTNETKKKTRYLNQCLCQRLHNGWCLSSPISNWTQSSPSQRLLSYVESKTKIAIASVQHVWFHPDMVLRHRKPFVWSSPVPPQQAAQASPAVR